MEIQLPPTLLARMEKRNKQALVLQQLNEEAVTSFLEARGLTETIGLKYNPERGNITVISSPEKE